MRWLRRVFTGFLTIVLVVSLFGFALSNSLSSAFSNPNHLKSWAQNSGFYSSLINKASKDTATSLGSTNLSSELNPVITQSLKNVFPENQLNQDLRTVINSNYSWLNGKTSAPNFVIDITQQKLAFANQLGSYVSQRYQSLPKCTYSQLVGLSTTNPLALVCKLATLSPASVTAQVVSQVQSSNIVVSNTVLTATSLKQGNKPYYEAYNLPAAYKHLKVAPTVLGIVSLICILGIVFANSRKRKTFIFVGTSFAIAGLMLIGTSIVSSKLDSKISTHISKHSNVSSFINSINSLVNKIVSFVSNINLRFGIVYLFIFVLLVASFFIKLKGKGRVNHKKNSNKEESKTADEPSEEMRPLKRVESMHPKLQPTAPELKGGSNRNKLIQ